MLKPAGEGRKEKEERSGNAVLWPLVADQVVL
jgi:hypothetical protein